MSRLRCRSLDKGGLAEVFDHVLADMDECQENSRICLNGRCVNVPGSFRCECERGYTHSADGTFCTDLDECQQGAVCQNGKCVNTQGGFQCLCHAGYVLSRDGSTCVGKTQTGSELFALVLRPSIFLWIG